jgi:hypothetical protein
MLSIEKYGNLFPQYHITCNTPELGKNGPFPKERSLLGNDFLHPLYPPENGK